MTDFIPPKPKSLTHKLPPFKRLIVARRSSIAALYDRSYTMKLGEVWTPFRRLYYLNQPDLVDRVLTGETEQFPKSRVTISILSLLLGNGIFVANGKHWRRQRKMVDTAFEQARVQEVFPLMRDAAEAMRKRVEEVQAGDIIAVDEEMTHVTADIIFRTIFSRPFSREEAQLIFHTFSRFQELSYLQGVWSMAGMPQWLAPGRFSAARHGRTIRNMLERAIQDRLDLIATSGADHHNDILASLLRARDDHSGEGFSRKQLIDEVAGLFLAGHETSASGLAWALYLIATHPSVQERLHAEAVSVLGTRLPEYSDIRYLKYTRDVFREALRLYPPIPFITRNATRAEKMRDKIVRKGAILFVSPWLLHRHQRHWDRPDVFDPDRFSTEAGRKSARAAYLPFSNGPRVCPGASFAMQEGVLILSYLAREFRFEPVPGHSPIPIGRISLRSENGIKLKLWRRPPQTAPTEDSSRASAEARCPIR